MTEQQQYRVLQELGRLIDFGWVEDEEVAATLRANGLTESQLDAWMSQSQAARERALVK